MMCSQQPPFKQRRYYITFGQQVITHLRLLSGYFMNKSFRAQPVITIPSIRSHYAGQSHRISYCLLQAFSRSVWHTLKSNTSNALVIQLYGYNNQNLTRSTPSTLSWFPSSNISLINLNYAIKSVTARTDHGTSKLVHPSPSRMVATQSQSSLQTQCANPIFLIRYVPHSAKPPLQGLSRPVENCSSCHRSLKITIRTVEQSSACPPSFFMLAL